jgi:hypothetical protein
VFRSIINNTFYNNIDLNFIFFGLYNIANPQIEEKIKRDKSRNGEVFPTTHSDIATFNP